MSTHATTTYAADTSCHARPAPGVETPNGCLGAIRDPLLRAHLDGGDLAPHAVAAMLRSFASDEEKLFGPRHLFNDLVTWVVTCDCTDSLLERVMDCQTAVGAESYEVLAFLNPAMSPEVVVEMATKVGGPMAECEHLMRGVMGGPRSAESGTDEQWLIAMTGLAATVITLTYEVLFSDEG